MAPGSNGMRRNSSSASAGPTHSHQSRMASSSGPMRRTSSCASAGGSYSQQGIAMPRRPNTIPLKKEKVSKIRPKLAKFREEHQKFHFESGLDAIDSNKIFAQAIRGRTTNSGRRPAALSVSEVTDVTNDTEVTGVTVLTFDGKTGLETQEKVKGRLDPVLKARKDLLRSMGTCEGCRGKKVKCFLSHHCLEDLLIEYPDARGDVEWALSIDADPKQAEQSITSPTRRSPAGALLETFPEEIFFGPRGQDPLRQVNYLFGVSNVGLPVYPDLEVEGLADMRSADNDFLAAGNMGYDNGLATHAQFPPSTASHSLFVTESQAQPFKGNNTFEPPSGQNDPSVRQRASSISTRASPRISLVPSGNYQGSFSAPHSASSEPQLYTYSPSDSLASAIQGSFQSSGQVTNAILASYSALLVGRGSAFKCMVPGAMTDSSLCGRLFASFEQMISHIRQSHRDYSIWSSTPMRSVCLSCWAFYGTTIRSCARCGRQIESYLCGTSAVFGSQNSTSVQSLGGDGMDIVSMPYDVWSMDSDVVSNENGVTSPMSDGRSHSSSGFEGGFSDSFIGNYNDLFDGSTNGYR